MLFIAFPAMAQEKAAGKMPVVLELFTTQSCSACPPADALMKQLISEDAELIALGCHVNYMDSEAWKDTMAKDFCKARHGGYLASIPLARIATPTTVINGQYDVHGPNEDLTRSAIKMVRSVETTVPLTLGKTGDAIDINLPDIPLEKPAEIWLFGFKPAETVSIGGGQNENTTVDYANTVTHLVKLMNWDGTHQKISYPLADIPAEGYAVIVQQEAIGPVIAAGVLKN
jgi:hypothetical protein